jgi:hypothetical protein
MKRTIMALTAGALALGVTASAADRTRVRTRSGRGRATTATSFDNGIQVNRTRTATRDGATVYRQGTGTVTGPGGRTLATTRGSGSTTWDLANRTVVRSGQGTVTAPNGYTTGGSYRRQRTAQGNGTWTSNSEIRNQRGDVLATGASTGHAAYDRSTHTATVDRSGDITGRNGNTAHVDRNYSATYDRSTHSINSTGSMTITGPNGQTYTTSRDRTATYGPDGRDAHTVYTGPGGGQSTSDMHTALSVQNGALTRSTNGTITGQHGRSATVDGQTVATYRNGTVTSQRRFRVRPTPRPTQSPTP